MAPARSVLVTGANGFIGNAVCRAYVRAGWTVYGLTRRKEFLPELAKEEIIPVLGSPGDLSFLPLLFKQQESFDAIVSTTEQIANYEAHFAEVMLLLRRVAEASNARGVRPLVLFTSGCKDYGMTGFDGSPDLAPHTEASPLKPPSGLAARTYNSVKVFEQTQPYDAVVLRPTTVYGRSGSYYGTFFEMAQRAKDSGQPLRLPADPRSVVHGTHVDDCAEAYVMLAEHRDRSRIAGQCYNISSHRYETLEEIAQALAAEYHLSPNSIVFEPIPEEKLTPDGVLGDEVDVAAALVGFSQWVGSQKLREDSGWTDKKPLFSERIRAYRIAYEQAAESGHSNVARVKGYVAAAERAK